MFLNIDKQASAQIKQWKEQKQRQELTIQCHKLINSNQSIYWSQQSQVNWSNISAQHLSANNQWSHSRHCTQTWDHFSTDTCFNTMKFPNINPYKCAKFFNSLVGKCSVSIVLKFICFISIWVPELECPNI